MTKQKLYKDLIKNVLIVEKYSKSAYLFVYKVLYTKSQRRAVFSLWCDSSCRYVFSDDISLSFCFHLES